MSEPKSISCSVNHSDEKETRKILEGIKENIPKEELLEEVSNLFKVIGDSTRMKILFSLTDKELCVYHIAQSLEMTQSAISHQLRVLKDNKLVKFRREGKQVFYSLDDNHVGTMLEQGLDHILEKH